MSQLDALRELALTNSELSGTIPTNLPAGLQHLSLAGNRLSGAIPSELDALTSLSTLTLCDNDFDASATLPPTLEAKRTSGTLAVVPCVSVADASATEGNALSFAVEFDTFPVRGASDAADVTVHYSTRDGTATSSDYSSVPAGTEASVVIPGNTDTGRTAGTMHIQVATTRDDATEDDETFHVLIQPPSGALATRPTATGTIRDGDGKEPPRPTPTPKPEPPPTLEPPPPTPTPEPPSGPTAPPDASFSVTGAACEYDFCTPFTGAPVTFEDTSTGAVTERAWNTGDTGVFDDSTLVHAWTEPGFHRVTLTVGGPGGSDATHADFLVRPSDPAGTCDPDDFTLCLQDERYRIEVDWWTAGGETGRGAVVREGTNDSGIFRFFDDANWEVLVKVLDACEVDGRHWLFAAATTDVGYEITVTDTAGTDPPRVYRNEPGMPAAATIDTIAFPDACERRRSEARSARVASPRNMP